MKMTQRLFAALAGLIFAAGAIAQTAPSKTPTLNIVLVHGALIDGSSWRGVYDALTKDGYHVSVAQLPLTGLDDDVAATQRIIDQLTGQIILVGHSYGGSVITVAGSDPKVKVLVYVAGLQPDVGETSAEVAPPKQQAVKFLRATKDGFIFLDPESFGTELGFDLQWATADFMAHSQIPIFGGAFTTKLTVAAWREKPSYAVIATEDRQLDKESAQRMADRARSKVTLLKGGHLIFVSQPSAVAQVIEEAARAVQ